MFGHSCLKSCCLGARKVLIWSGNGYFLKNVGIGQKPRFIPMSKYVARILYQIWLDCNFPRQQNYVWVVHFLQPQQRFCVLHSPKNPENSPVSGTAGTAGTANSRCSATSLVLPQARTKSSPNRLQVKISDMAGKRCGCLVRISGGFWAGNIWH